MRSSTSGGSVDLGVEVHRGHEEERLLQGIDLVVKSPGVPGETRARRERARARRSRVGRDRARRRGSSRTRSSASRGRTARRPRASSSARSSVPHGRSVEVAGNVGRPLTSLVGTVGRRRMDRLRALLVPARGRAYVEAARRRPPQSRGRPSRPPRDLRGVRRREAPDVRAVRPGRTSPFSRAGSSTSPVRHDESTSQVTTLSPPNRGSPARTTARTRPPRPLRRGLPASRTTPSATH